MTERVKAKCLGTYVRSCGMRAPKQGLGAVMRFSIIAAKIMLLSAR